MPRPNKNRSEKAWPSIFPALVPGSVRAHNRAQFITAGRHKKVLVVGADVGHDVRTRGFSCRQGLRTCRPVQDDRVRAACSG